MLMSVPATKIHYKVMKWRPLGKPSEPIDFLRVSTSFLQYRLGTAEVFLRTLAFMGIHGFAMVCLGFSTGSPSTASAMHVFLLHGVLISSWAPERNNVLA